MVGLIGVLALMGKNGEEHGGVWESIDGGGIGEFLAVREVGLSMGEVGKEWGSVGIWWVKVSVERCVRGGEGKCVWGVGNVMG